jgi:uncharacterized protein (TIGR02117 family)
VLTACAAPGAPTVVGDAPIVSSIYLVSHGWHTGIVLRRVDVPRERWPEIRDFPDTDYLEVGWGDEDFYRMPDPGLWITFKAAFLPTASVVHVVGLRGAPAVSFPASEIVEVPVTRPGLDALVQYVHDAYRRGDAPSTPALGPGLYGDSRFYPGRESFHLFRTCNVWTAGALRSAGLPVQDSITSEGLIAQVRKPR